MTAPTTAQCLAEIENIPVHQGGREKTDGDLPLASIVIATLNCVNELPATLDSISAQTWLNLEVVIADGGSNDGTLDLLQERADMISKWISTPDRGISEGFSRAVAMSTGTVVQIICAGDRLTPNHIERSITLLRENPAAGYAYGDVEMIDAEGRHTRMTRGVAAFHLGHFDSMAVAPHMALCSYRATYETVGLFDSDMLHVMDFDWLARCWRVGINGAYSNFVGARMTESGNNNRHAIERDLENFKVTRRYGTMPTPLASLRLGLRLGMDGVRLSLEAMGAERASYEFRRWVDFCLGRS
jgi:glycosyltransferase